jgi:hypothetical protein
MAGSRFELRDCQVGPDLLVALSAPEAPLGPEGLPGLVGPRSSRKEEWEAELEPPILSYAPPTPNDATTD